MGGGGGGGSTSVNFRNPSQEKGTIGNWYDFQQNQLQNYINQSPLLSAANTGALNFFNQLPQLTGPLQSQYQNLPSITPTLNNLQSQFGGLPQQLSSISQGLQSQFGGLPAQLQQQFGGIPAQLQGLTTPLRQTASGYLSGIIGNRGALGREDLNAATQQSLGSQALAGTAHTLPGLARLALDQQAAKEARYNTALGQYEGVGQNVGALDQLAQSLGTNLAQVRQGLGTGLAQTRAGLGQLGQSLGLGLQQGISGLRGQDIAQRLGLAGGLQNLQSGGLNQLTGVQGSNVSTYGGLTNPILAYLGNLFGGNLQASVDQAKINAQQNIASQSQKGSTTGGAISSIGSIIGAVAPLLMFSDERLKTKIRETGLKTPEGIDLKTFEFKTRPGVRLLGPMAQDVEKKLPSRVITDPQSGVKMVVGFPIIEVSPIGKKVA